MPRRRCSRRRASGWRRIGDRVSYVHADLGQPLPIDEPVDAVLSTATFHWVPDHDALFAESRRRAPSRRLAGRPVRRLRQHRAVHRGRELGRPELHPQPAQLPDARGDRGTARALGLRRRSGRGCPPPRPASTAASRSRPSSRRSASGRTSPGSRPSTRAVRRGRRGAHARARPRLRPPEHHGSTWLGGGRALTERAVRRAFAVE